MKKLKHLSRKETSGIFKALVAFSVVLIVLCLVLPVVGVFLSTPAAQHGRLVFSIVLICVLGLTMPLFARGAFYRETKMKLETMEEAQSTAYTDDVIKLSQQAVEMPVSLPVAWDCLKEATNGLDIKALDKRRAAWLVDSVDDDRRTVKCSLQYIQDPMGRKLSQIYPRTIEMVASVDGSGINTKLRTRYSFATPMDLEAVSEIISKTNLRLNEMIVTADKSYKEQRETRRSAAVAQLEKPLEIDLDNLGSISFPVSLN
jgi:hypothetical protein